MTPEDRVRAGDVTLVFDAANVSTRALFKLAKSAVDRGANIRSVVPATAHLEKLLDLRQAKGAHYDASHVRAALENAGVVILPLDAEAVELAAERLHRWFPDDGAWQTAKRKRLNFGTDKRAPATIDWITAAMCPTGAIVVTDDMGTEFKDCETVGSSTLEIVLATLAPPGHALRTE